MDNKEPIKAGDKFTYTIGSDRYIYSVKEVISPKRLILTPDGGGGEREVSFRKNGKWIAAGESQKAGYYVPGDHGAYRDPSF